MENLKLLSKIALSFQNLSYFDRDMNEILKNVGSFIDVSRIYIILNESKEIMSNTFEWCNTEVEPQIENLRSIKCEEVPSWYSLFKDKGYICVSNIDELPEDVRLALKPQKIKSIVVYPLIVKNKTIGFIGFDECRDYRIWKEEELEILHTISGLIASTYERKKADQALKESEKRFMLALDETKAGLWDFDLENNTVYLSPTWKMILGYKDEELENNFQSWVKLWHPDEVDMIQKNGDDYFYGRSKHYEFIHRLKHKDGSWRWILCRGGILRTDDGEQYRWIGTIIDITKEHEQALELERFFSINLDLLCIISLNGIFLKVNKAWQDVLGYSTDNIIGHKFTDFIHKDDIAETSKIVKKLKNEGEVTKFINRYISREGDSHYIEWRANAYGDVIYAAARDVTERIQYEKRILEASNRDALTGAYNRRYVYKRAKEIVEEYQRIGKVFSVCILDIDEFKTINDKYGHQAGDYVLKEFTNIINKNLRPYDLLGRYGGEEFIIILNNIDSKKSNIVIRRILNIIRNTKFKFNEENIEFTFSAGISVCKEITTTDMVIDKLVEIADRRMYQAKNSGKNKIVFRDIKIAVS